MNNAVFLHFLFKYVFAIESEILAHIIVVKYVV